MGKSVGTKKKTIKSPQLNPNWALLREKLKNQESENKFRKPSEANGKYTVSILGKRKNHPISVSESIQPQNNNVLIPTSSDSSLTAELAMDCEMVGVSPLGNKSALGRVTLVNKWGNVVYDTHVRPVERVVDFRTEISGIRPHDLKKAKDFPTVQKKIAELIKGKILVGHALRNDLKVGILSPLPPRRTGEKQVRANNFTTLSLVPEMCATMFFTQALLLSHPKKDIRDTSEYKPFLKEARRKSLRHLAAEFLGAQIQNGEHCPIEDARAAMMLYQRNKKDWERRMKDQGKLKEKQKKRRPKKKSKKEEDAAVEHDATA